MVFVPTCLRMLGEHPFHILGKKYADAVRLAGCVPLTIPDAGVDDIDTLLDMADGVLLTGSPSNVHPTRYGEAQGDGEPLFDEGRDALNLALIPKAIERGIPLLGICRGFQETNVALGGSLHQAVHKTGGLTDHRGAQGRADASAEEVYALAHPVEVSPGGVLSEILGAGPVTVNSVHGQGVARLAAGLRVEARAPDGLIEAFSMPEAKGFNLCVQWHPEWKAADHPSSMRILRAFGNACQHYRRRARPEPAVP
jgi:putative glutamine amidotransferase